MIRNTTISGITAGGNAATTAAGITLGLRQELFPIKEFRAQVE